MYISVSDQTPETVKQIGGDTLSRGVGKVQTQTLSSRQRQTYFDLNDTHRIHAWLRANISAFGRSVIGTGMTLAPDSVYGTIATTEERDVLQSFYRSIDGRDIKNISDWYPESSKIYRTAGQYRLFGQAAWELRKNGFKEVVSYDVIPGFIYPNCNEDGTFKDPPFFQYLSSTGTAHELELKPEDIVLFMQPDLGERLFSTDFESLSEYVLPTDLYLNLAMRSVLENYRTPMGVYSLDEMSTPEDVASFSTKLDTLYKGADKYGSSAVVVRGETEFNSFAAPLKDLPFQAGHSTMQDEIEGVSGVSGAKLGRTGELNRSNMREMRRDYWETTLQPVSLSLADQMYLLIHQRIFGINTWRPKFNAPDFLTQVEKATIGMRGRQWSALNTNEFRAYAFGYDAIDEEWADEDYLWPTNMALAGGSTINDTGDDEDIEDENPADEPDTGSDAPIRGDTEEGKTAAIKEMRSYARFCLNRFDDPKKQRPFNFRSTPTEIILMVNKALVEYGQSKDNVKQIFDAVLKGMKGG